MGLSSFLLFYSKHWALIQCMDVSFFLKSSHSLQISVIFFFKCLENYNSGCSFRVCCRPPWICHTKQLGYIPVQNPFSLIFISVFFSQAAFFNRHSLSYVTLSEPQTSFIALGHSWMHSHSSSLLLLFTQREKGAWHLFLQSLNAANIERVKNTVSSLSVRILLSYGHLSISASFSCPSTLFFQKKKLWKGELF